MLALIAIWASLISSTSAQTNSCVAVKSTVKALKSGSDPKIYEYIYPGEPLKVIAVTKDRKHTKVSLGGDPYWIAAKELETLDGTKCSLNLCAYLEVDDAVYSRPNKKSTATVIDEGLFPVVTNIKSWYRVKIASGFVWLSGAQLKSYKRSCDGSDADEPREGSATKPPSGWQFGLEAGYIQNVSSESIKNLLTPVPANGVDVNDDAFDSPFIDEVTDGTGWFAGVTTEFPLFSGFRNRVAFGYKTRSLEYIQRRNPHNASVSFITYDQLVPETVAVDFTFIYATTTVKFEGWSFLGMIWQPGVLLGVDYSLEELEIEFRTAPQKLTPYLVGTGYQTIEFLYGPRLDINIGFLTLGLSAIFTDYGMEPTATLGVQF